MIKGCLLLVVAISFISSLSWAQDNDSQLQTALAANKFLKEEVRNLKGQKEGLLNSFKVMNQQNSVLRQEIYQAQMQHTNVVTAGLSIGQLLSLRKELADTHFNLGVLLQGQNKFDEAIKEYQKVLEINPDDADANYNLALIFDTDNKNSQQALLYYQRFLELNPQAPEANDVRSRMKVLAGIM